MDQTRRSRITSVLERELTPIIARKLKDPRIGPIAITKIDLSSDASQAVIYISPISALSDATEAKECVSGLNSAAGFLRRHVADFLQIRNIPHLIFKADAGIENTSRVHELLKQIEREPSSDDSDT
ncbi:MAG: ribosome-binding factor A [Bdellovibrionaceae bacterium]|nr:ribosome-binding factor A [Pseudobdellovibrionaceae bacterium]|tara:strand:+ start:1335 stop:1712 length:378 start_codon:yes stop_codon:yes gene_type:complete